MCCSVEGPPPDFEPLQGHLDGDVGRVCASCERRMVAGLACGDATSKA